MAGVFGGLAELIVSPGLPCSGFRGPAAEGSSSSGSACARATSFGKPYAVSKLPDFGSLSLSWRRRMFLESGYSRNRT